MSSAEPVKRLRRPLCLLACCGLTSAALGATTLAPAINWMSALFTKENYHSMTLRGSRASFPASGEINVVNLNLTAFSGDATNRVETVILSTAATVLIKEDLARGDQGMRLIRDDLEATGTQWTYDHAHKKVSLHGRVRIVFNAEFKHLLK